MNAVCSKSFLFAIFLGIMLLAFAACQNKPQHVSHSEDRFAQTSAKTELPVPVELPEKDGMRLLPGGEFLMGADKEMPNEAPVHTVKIKPFWIDKTEVTVGDFEKFIKATNYKTEAEKFGWSGVFKVEESGWVKADGANWRNPFGDKTKPNPNEPVSQVSWTDANEYAKWAGKRLPTEAEWEYAARGGLVQKRYVWGDELRPNGKPVANWWQGDFPEENTFEDGFLKLAPIGSFAPNGYGLFDMTGNVWEWTADWYDENYYQNSPTENPTGPTIGREKVIRGGSWLCSEVYCSNYRTSARSHTPPDSGLNNTGFRCVRDN